MDVSRIIYCSRRAITGGDAAELALREILAVARVNNARDGITGALVASGGCFAQILEGPPDAVRLAFDKIQTDDRHYDVAVLPAESAAERAFPIWSMGFVSTAEEQAIAIAVIEGAFATNDVAAAHDIWKLIRDSIASAEVW